MVAVHGAPRRNSAFLSLDSAIRTSPLRNSEAQGADRIGMVFLYPKRPAVVHATFRIKLVILRQWVAS
jgi:hypothetical protein